MEVEEEEEEGEELAGQVSVVREAAQAETIAVNDALDRAALTKAVADLLTTRTDKHPLAMALFGAWGAGKSSFIDFVKKEVASRTEAPFRFAEFNAWRNERVDNIGAALAQAVVESVVAERSFFEQMALALRLAKRRNARLRKALAKDAAGLKAWTTSTWEWLKFTLAYFAFPLAVGAIALAFFLQTEAYKVVAGAVGSAVTGLVALFSVKSALSNELLNWFKKLAKDQKFSLSVLPDYREKLGSFHEMGRTLEDLCALTLSNPNDGRADFLLLVIDDLDRCSPDTIKQVFDAVRLVANIPQVVVLVALDERIAYSAVAKHYAEYGFSDRETAQVARDYMSKVFNVFVSLPGAQKKVIENYVRTRLFDVPADFPGTTTTALPPTPETPAARRQRVRSSSALEAQTFSELVSAFEMSNPRELWRLRQTWSLLKGFALPEQASDEVVRAWMQHMFFRETFLRGTAEQRRNGKPILEKLISGTADSSERLWTPALTRTARDIGAGFDVRDAAVMSVLLPAAPADIKAAGKPA
ncbi:KAP family P-loop NTPase fold protein [Ramlibacter humi]|uniref:KAP family P-loop NTPase fold protein n=1 Tax=Ramlibacter humi TaxID=2530451 RepID=UPI00142FAB42|nr:P-loop NTPase fold protein [Ramlibacter humi]